MSTRPKAGGGHFIHTYQYDGNPMPSYEGEPTPVTIDGDIDAFTAKVWKNLNADNKVSLFTRFIDLATGETQTRISTNRSTSRGKERYIRQMNCS